MSPNKTTIMICLWVFGEVSNSNGNTSMQHWHFRLFEHKMQHQEWLALNSDVQNMSGVQIDSSPSSVQFDGPEGGKTNCIDRKYFWEK